MKLLRPLLSPEPSEKVGSLLKLALPEYFDAQPVPTLRMHSNAIPRPLHMPPAQEYAQEFTKRYGTRMPQATQAVQQAATLSPNTPILHGATKDYYTADLMHSHLRSADPAVLAHELGHAKDDQAGNLWQADRSSRVRPQELLDETAATRHAFSLPAIAENPDHVAKLISAHTTYGTDAGKIDYQTHQQPRGLDSVDPLNQHNTLHGRARRIAKARVMPELVAAQEAHDAQYAALRLKRRNVKSWEEESALLDAQDALRPKQNEIWELEHAHPAAGTLRRIEQHRLTHAPARIPENPFVGPLGAHLPEDKKQQLLTRIDQAHALATEHFGIEHANTYKAKMLEALENPRPYRFGDWAQRFEKPLLQGVKKLADIKTPLLSHQQRVVDKIQRPDQPGLVVAHSVGSGKTLTALAAQDALKMNATAVMPAALRANYRKEMAKHQAGVSPTTDIESLQGVALSGETTPNALLISDEAHRVREPSTKAYKALAANDATKRLLMTGTPFYNHPADIAPLINLASGQRVMPTQRGEFEKKYVRDRMVQPGFFKSLRGVQPGVVTELNPMSKGELASHLSKWVDYYPGSKQGFPTTTEENIEVPMDAEQLQVYDTMMKKAPFWVAAKVKAGLPPSKAESKELNAFLGAVRQVSNTTGGFGGRTVHSPKIQRAYEELEKEMAQNPEARAVIYSNFLESGVHPYRQLLQAHHVPFGEFTGEQKPADRDQMVRDYNEGKLKALLLSSAGGEGLDLKKTSLMQLLEPHWNSTRGDQVIGRGVRYMSHEGMAEDAQKVRIQRFLATRPRSGLLERAHLKDPGMGVDQYLTQMSADKSRLIDQFKALLEAQNQRELAEAAAKEQAGQKAAAAPLLRPRVTVFIHNEKNEVLAEHRSGPGGYYHLPGGGIEAGQSVRAAARREALEEVGYDVGKLRSVHPPTTLIWPAEMKKGFSAKRSKYDGSKDYWFAAPVGERNKSLYGSEGDALRQAKFHPIDTVLAHTRKQEGKSEESLLIDQGKSRALAELRKLLTEK